MASALAVPAHAVTNQYTVTAIVTDATGAPIVDPALVNPWGMSGGRLRKPLVRAGALNSPWGLVRTPANWGAFAGDLLVGNFGDGRIHAYNSRGVLQGTLRHNGRDIRLNGLWGLLFGNGTSAATSALLFTSGPGEESHGCWGVITVGSGG